MQPTPGDVHVNTPLTNVSVAYVQEQRRFVAGRVFPEVQVTKESDRYYTYDRGEFNRDEMEERAPAAESAGSGYTVDNTPTYSCRTYAFHHDIPDRVRANADPQVDPDRDATRLYTTKALIKRERLWANTYFKTNVWTFQATGAGSSPGSGEFLQWDDGASTPIEDVRAAKTDMLESTGYEPNVLVLGRRVFDKLIDHPDIVDRIKYGQTPGDPAIADLEVLAKLFGIGRVEVMSGIHNTAKKGQTASHAFIGGKHALLVHAAPAPGLMTPSAGYTFVWTGYMGAGENGQRISTYRMDLRKADRVEIEMSFDQKLVAADLGYFFGSAVA